MIEFMLIVMANWLHFKTVPQNGKHATNMGNKISIQIYSIYITVSLKQISPQVTFFETTI